MRLEETHLQRSRVRVWRLISLVGRRNQSTHPPACPSRHHIASSAGARLGGRKPTERGIWKRMTRQANERGIQEYFPCSYVFVCPSSLICCCSLSFVPAASLHPSNSERKGKARRNWRERGQEDMAKRGERDEPHMGRYIVPFVCSSRLIPLPFSCSSPLLGRLSVPAHRFTPIVPCPSLPAILAYLDDPPRNYRV